MPQQQFKCVFLLIGDTVDNHTLLFHILDNTTNGDQIVLKELDRCVVTDAPDLQQTLSYNYNSNKIDRLDKLRIDFSRLESTPSTNLSSIGSVKGCLIKDVMRTSPDKRQELLLHPVFVTYVDECWKKITKYIWGNFLIYMIFLIAFGRFLTNSFYRDLHIEVIVRALPNENKAEEIPGLATVQPVAPVRPTEHGLTRGQIYNFCAQIASTTQSSENDTG